MDDVTNIINQNLINPLDNIIINYPDMNIISIIK